MAGIGFKLRDLLNSNESSSRFHGLAAALVIVGGPSFFMACGIFSFQTHPSFSGSENTFVSMLIYAYIISWLCTGSLDLIFTRYFSDLVYLELLTSVPRLLSYSIITGIFASLATAGLLCWAIGVSPAFCLFTAMLSGILGAVYSVTMYVSATRSYFLIVLAYALGVGFALAISWLLTTFGQTNELAHISAWAGGQTLTVVILILALQREFGSESDKPPFLKRYFQARSNYFYLGILTALAPCIDKITFWISPWTAKVVSGGFISYPPYDSSIFFASLVSIPCLAVFLVRSETSFHVAVREEFDAIENGATLREIVQKSEDLAEIGRKSILEILEIGIVVSAFVIFFSFTHLEHMKMSPAIFRWGLIGYAFFFPMVFANVFLLYFGRVNEVMKILKFYTLTCFLLSFASTLLDPVFHGIGFALSSVFGFIYSFVILRFFLKNHTVHAFTDYDAGNEILPSRLSLEFLKASE